MHPSVESFLDYLSAERRSSDHTFQAYRLDLEQFGFWLRERFELDDPRKATSVMIRDWIVNLREAGKMEARSVNRKLSSLRSYYKYVQRDHPAGANPMKGIRSLKTPRRIVRTVDVEDMDRLLDPALYEGETALRDRMLILTLYFTGMRRAEIISLRWRDVDWDNRQIRVTGKRNKERIIPLTGGYLDELRQFREAQTSHFSVESGAFLFPGKDEQSLDPRVVYAAVVHYIGQVSSIEKKSPHVLRHTFATHLLNMGADIQTIKELLGHAGLAATQVYTHNSIEQIKSVYNRSHPRSHK